MTWKQRIWEMQDEMKNPSTEGGRDRVQVWMQKVEEFLDAVAERLDQEDNRNGDD